MSPLSTLSVKIRKASPKKPRGAPESITGGVDFERLPCVQASINAGRPLPAQGTQRRSLRRRPNLNAICTRAQVRGVRIILDAEYSWYQPALALMRRFNALHPHRPRVYTTFQAYLRPVAPPPHSRRSTTPSHPTSPRALPPPPGAPSASPPAPPILSQAQTSGKRNPVHSFPPVVSPSQAGAYGVVFKAQDSLPKKIG
ncbi:hypothetical protein B0H14DRAFT_3428161 [Mycena olivaceomarginata]|nr:hypothetical protein B0H14DRAFT_3428161 [Mycena olivaceomarginata]